LKRELHEKNFGSQEEVISVVRLISAEILLQKPSIVFDEWIDRLHECTANEVE
jgi:hypothetical protein